MPARHSLIELPERTDVRGTLTFAQQGDHIPFGVKRFFVIHGVPAGAGRGSHAHRDQHQFLVLLHGRADVTIKNGQDEQRVTLDRSNLALHAPPMLWLELENFSADACCMVLVSDVYLESDYIRDWETFARLARQDSGEGQ